MPDHYFDIFIIQRFNIRLKVVVPSDRRVIVEPFNCKDTNMRLWRGISQVQAMLAQTVLDENKISSSYNTLALHFTKLGWNVTKSPES